jgi:hypothetical protein
LDFEREHTGFKAFIVRPGGVLESEGVLAHLATGLGVPVVGVKALGAVMVHMAVTGEGERVVENRELVLRGRELLKGQEQEGK